ncbi:MAG: ABC transporter ATP-binding protein, partial [Planctomycetota bacterium]
ERTRYNERVDHAFELARKRSRMGAIFMGVFSFGGYAAIALVLWYGGRLLVAGELTLGELTSFVLYTFAVAFALGALSGLWESFMRALGASDRIFELLDREPTLVGGTLKPDTVEGRVRFDHVDFAYPTRPDAPVLRAFDLELVLGGTTALVGPSGAGKSTVRALLSRLYDPDGGQILLDDRDLRELDPDWLRSQVGVVAQEPILFAATIAENIRYGRPDATDAEVDAVAQAANATAFIEAFPEGTETLVGERGVRLSGGQKQRIAIARALLEDPRVLVLDEATSALDSESEHLVQTALAALMEGRTTLVIAHRLSTVMQADRVVVLDAGRVAESGTHDELMAAGGLYRQLVERQFTEVPALFT